MTLTRSTAGLVGYDDFSGTFSKWGTFDPNTGSTATPTWTVSGGYLRGQRPAGNTVGFQPFTMTARGDQVVCAMCRTEVLANSQPGLIARYSSDNKAYTLQLDNGTMYLWEYPTGGTGQYSFSQSASTWYKVKLSAIGTALVAYLDTGSGLVSRVSGTDSSLSTGAAGLWIVVNSTSSDNRWDDFSVCTSDTITCTGLPAGSSIAVTDGTVTVTANTSSGSAAAACGTIFYGSAGVTLKVYSSTGGTGTLLDTTTGVFGGDTWAYESSGGTTYATQLFRTRYLNPSMIGGM